MLVTKMGTVTGVRNAAIMVAVVSAVVSNGLSLLPFGLLRLLLALGLLTLRLLLALRLGLALCSLLALWLRFLGALRLRFLGTLRLRFLGTLRLRFLGALRLRFLGPLWLRLVLRWLCFSLASALFLLAFLCERRNGGSEK